MGVKTIKTRHEGHFSDTMGRTEVALGSVNTTQTCSRGNVSGRLKSFGAGCKSIMKSAKSYGGGNAGNASSGDSNQMRGLSPAPNYDLEQIVDVKLVSQAYTYGRYLLFSAASHTPINLQGLWTDGPSSSWNGDYHMNINMQESYWAADVSGISEVYGPLMGFIKRMSEAGQLTAKNTYGVRTGWVTHAFTDNRMGCGMLGEAQWSLCVTCGAWLALQGFDHLTYKFDREALLDVMLPTLRGVAQFFSEYLYVDPLTGTTHTGPTTSPENSYTFGVDGEGERILHNC